MITTIEWLEIETEKLWRSTDGAYAILAVTIPENPPRAKYQLRRIDEAMARAYADRGYLGYLLAECDTLWRDQNSIDSAQAVAERHAFRRRHNDSIPADLPAVTLRQFYWPISDGTSRAALTVAWENGKLCAQVVGMTRDNDAGYTPAAYVTIDLTALGLRPADGVDLTNCTDHGKPCPNCCVAVGEQHDEGCDRARCEVTGQQRMLCKIFGDSTFSGLEALATGQQDEFETFFKAPVSHDCGHDVWTGV